MNYKQISGDAIRGKREELGHSQAELAKLLTVSTQTVRNWEKAKTYPSGGSLWKLKERIGLDVATIGRDAFIHSAKL